MPSKKPQFVIRTEKEVLDKIAFIAHENERNSTQEIVYLIKKRIKAYEAEHGEIIIENKTKDEIKEKQKKLINDKKEGKVSKLETIKGSWENGIEYGKAKK